MAAQLIAHRGYPDRYPENTRSSFEAAVAAGASWLETDIQFSRDRAAVLYHDGTLDRTSGLSGHPWDHDVEQLYQIGAAYSERFGEQFGGEPIMSLTQFVTWATPHAKLRLLIELKKETLNKFGVPDTVDTVVETLRPIADRCVVISFITEALEHCRQISDHRLGWVLPEYSPDSERIAHSLQPDFMICNLQRLPPSHEPLWDGDWQWMVYPINDAEVAFQQTLRGIQHIETDKIGSLILDPRLRT